MFIKKFLLVGLSTLFLQPAAANDCAAVSTVDLAKIKEYLTCQHKPGIEACLALGSVIATRAGGRFLQSAITESSAGEFEKNRVQFIQETAEKMHAETRKGPMVDAYKTRKAAEAAIRNSEVAFEKAMGDSSLSAAQKEKLKRELLSEIAKQRAVASHCLEMEKAGKFQIRSPVFERVGDRFVEVASKSFNELPMEAKAVYTDKAYNFYHQAHQRIASGHAFASTFSNKSLAGMRVGLTRLAGVDLLKRGALLVVGGGSLAAQVGFALATYSPSTGCSSLTEKYTNAQGSSCLPQVGLSPGVLEFLDLPTDIQQDYLKTRSVCSFYAKLKNELLNQGLGKVSCEGRVAKYEVYHRPYGSYQSTIRFREDKSIQSIVSDFGPNGSVVHLIDETGKDVNLRSVGLKEAARLPAEQSVHAAKLFAPVVSRCCRSADTERESCLLELNGPPPKMLTGADQADKTVGNSKPGTH